MLNDTEGRWSVPKGWEWKTIGQIAKVVGGGTPKASEGDNFADPGTAVAWVTPADLTGYEEATISFGRRDLSDKGLAESSARVLPEGAVLFSSRAPIGYCAVAANPIATNQGFKSLVLRSDMDSGFVRHYLLSSTAYAEQSASGTTFKELSGARMKELLVPVPPLPEQRRIVARLDAIEAHRRAAKERLEALPARLDQYRQSVLAAAFRGDLTAGWRAQHPDAEPADALLDRIRAERRRRWTDSLGGKSPKKYKKPVEANASDAPGLPNGWAWMTLEELTSPDRPLCYGVVQPGSDPGDGIPLVRVQDLLGGSIQTDELRRIAPDVDAQYRRSRVQAGDVLVSLVGTIGRVAVVGPEVGYANIARAVGRVSALDGLGEWLACCLQSPQLQDWLALESREVARKTLNLGTLAQALVPVPPPAEMAAAVACVSECLGRQKTITAATRSASERTDQLRQATLARAFRGELVPTDAALARRGAHGMGDGQTALDL